MQLMVPQQQERQILDLAAEEAGGFLVGTPRNAQVHLVQMELSGLNLQNLSLLSLRFRSHRHLVPIQHIAHQKQLK